MFSKSTLLVIFMTIIFYLLYKYKFNASQQWTEIDRIIGGTDTDIENVPFIVSIEYKKRHNCGGSILSAVWILTAAHCLEGKLNTELGVRAGSTYKHRDGFLTPVSESYYHESFNQITMDYDVGVIKVSQSLPLSDNPKTMQIAKLPSSSDVIPVGIKVIVAGWGWITLNASRPEHLKWVDLVVWDNNDCNQVHTRHEITEHMVCAGEKQRVKSVYKGDSGGPLFDNNRVVVGIASWVASEETLHKPGVFSRVQKLREWIKVQSGI